MEFSWITFWATSLFVVFSGFVSWREGTFTRESRRKVNMGFLNHGGMWSDALVLPFVNGLIVAYAERGPSSEFVSFLLAMVAVGITFLAHWAWSREGFTNHMWPSHAFGHWARDLSNAGRLHVLFMGLELCLLIMYLMNPMPTSLVLAISALLTVHIPLGVIQPGWFVKREALSSIPPAAMLLVATWGVAVVKVT